MGKLLYFIVNHWILVTAFLISLVSLVILEMSSKVGSTSCVTIIEAIHLINQKNALIIDVRSHEAYSKGHIINAINIPSTELDENLKQIERYKQLPLIIVCAKGDKSSSFMSQLRKHGYERIYILTGGMHAWNNANMPVVK